MMKDVRSVLFAALTISVPSFALGADYYVAVATGSNANSGTAPGAAWQTITHAMTAIPTGAHTLHVAPGTYSAATGEVFPILFKPDLKMNSDGGPSVTIVDATGSAGAIRLESSLANPVSYKYQLTEIRGFTILAGGYGIDMYGSVLQTTLTLWQSQISGATVAGIKMRREGGILGMNVFDSSLVGNAIGALYDIGQGQDTALGGGLNIQRSVVRNSAGDGIRILTNPGKAHCLVVQTYVEGNGGDGFHFLGFESTNSLMTTNSSYSGNGGMGIREEPFFPGLRLKVNMTACTVAHNASTGVSTTEPTITGSILWGNALDLAGINDEVNWSDVGTGIALGVNNVSADPLFTNPAALDFRPSWGSPCLDASSGAGGGFDIDGQPRGADSDLDTYVGHEMGALELHTLRLVGVPAIGTTPTLEILGETGSTSIVLLSAFPTGDAGVGTAYGKMLLDPSKPFFVLPAVPAGPGPFGVLPIPIPPNPLLIGVTAYFQALTKSSNSLVGAAFSNRVTLAVQ